MPDSEVISAIERAIKSVESKFWTSPDVFLTEQDLRCHLFLELSKEPVLSKLQETQDNGLSIPIHSEVRWYGRDRKLKTRSDIVILKVSQLRTSKNGGLRQLPSKGYGFSEPLAVIETKLRRVNGSSDRQWKNDINKDIEKLKELESSVDRNALYYLIAFDKKTDLGNDIPTDPAIKIHYVAKPTDA